MKTERLQQIEEIYHAALEVAPDKRESFFNEFCGADEELRREVKSLLAFEKSSDNLPDKSPESFVAVFSEKKDSTNLIGKAVNQYKILALVGKGGMGEVYLAQDTRLDRRVALKILPPDFIDNRGRMELFVREAKTASALNHPNIITIYEIGVLQDTHYIATELIEGETLRELTKSREPDLRETLDIAIQMASALVAAHAAGIVHRDIKPDNVMLRRDGFVKILDFGLAKLTEPQIVGADDETLLQSIRGSVKGTIVYMSPEQARGLQVDARTDIWSFGVTLYELLTRRLPFAGASATDVMFSIVQKEPPSLQFIAPDLPNELFFIVNKTLRKNLDERYQNIKDVLNDLRQVKQKLDYEQFERSFSPETSKRLLETEQTKTVSLTAISSDSNKSISLSTVPPNNLSSELSPLIGREAELAEIMDLLRQPNTRLLTITGVGGTGKTRIAQAIAHESLMEFSDGVYFISLSAIENPELVIPIIGQTLGVQEESGKSLKERIGDYLREKKMLIVLDNFEQITQAAPMIGELLLGSVNLKILVTSRVHLHLRFEHELTLQPLAVPTDKRLSLDELNAYPAVALFVERAKAAKSNFALTDENADSVAEICRRLDGLPLAIELAAVRVKMLSPQAILTRLTNSLKLLTGGARDLPERQQTMRGAIAWSYDLLDADEKKLLNRLAVFARGFTLEGAEAIALNSNFPNTDLKIDIFDVLSSLVDKSLLAQREQADGEPRFRTLEVVREFALETLTASGEADEIKHRHAAFFANLSEEAEPQLLSANAAIWYEKLEQEHDNLRVALEWTLEYEPETALRIVTAIYRFWLGRGHLAEGSKWTRAALEKNNADIASKLRAKAARGIGNLSVLQGDFEAANFYYQTSLRLSREIGDKQLICYALAGLGNMKTFRGDLSSGRTLIEESLTIAREINDKLHITLTLNSLGEIARDEVDYQAARSYYEEALAIAKKESLSIAIPTYTGNLASVTCLLEDYQAAHSYCLESLKISEELGDKKGIGGALDRLAALAVKDGKMEKAAYLWGAAQSIFEAIGYKIEKVDQDFKDRYSHEARMAISDEAFDAAQAEGKLMQMKKAIALARATN